MNATEQKHLDRLSELPCAVCDGPSEVIHHPRAFAGMGQRAPHMLAIPTCVECHVGAGGIHGDKSAWRVRKLNEPAALAKTWARYVERW